MVTPYTPLIQSTVQETLREALARAEEATFASMMARRQMCMDFYRNEVLAEDGGSNDYLKNFFGYQQKNGQWIYKKTLLLEHLNLTEQLIDLKAKNYREQPVRLVDDVEAEKYTDLLWRSKWFAVSKSVDQYTNLLHDVAVQVILDEKTKFLKYQLITDYYPVFDPEDTLQVEPVAIVYPTAKRDKKTGGVVYAYWDEDQTLEMDNMGQVTSESKPNTLGVFPFFFPHAKHPAINHFSTPSVSVVLSNQAIDVALSALNQLMHYNGYKQLVIKGKVAGTNEAGQDVQFALGNAQTIQLEPVLGSEGFNSDVSVLDMQVDMLQHLETIKGKMELAANSLNVEFQWKIEGGPQSGYSLDVQNSRDFEDRRIKFEVIEDWVEQPMYKIVSVISEKFGLDIEQGELTIDFAEPKSEMQVTDKIAWQKWMMESGQWTLKDLILENNPELTEADAEKRAQKAEAEKAKKQEEFAKQNPVNEQKKQQPQEEPNA